MDRLCDRSLFWDGRTRDRSFPDLSSSTALNSRVVLHTSCHNDNNNKTKSNKYASLDILSIYDRCFVARKSDIMPLCVTLPAIYQKPYLNIPLWWVLRVKTVGYNLPSLISAIKEAAKAALAASKASGAQKRPRQKSKAASKLVVKAFPSS